MIAAAFLLLFAARLEAIAEPTDGPVRYEPGSGLRVRDLGLTIGGFATAAAERLEGGEARGGVEGLNLLVFLEPVPFLRAFAEIELEKLLEWESGSRGARSDPGTDVDRLFVEAGSADRLNVRIGKFLTPVGRWNPAPAEPFVWTTSEPVIVEEVFDEVVSGAMASGTVFPSGGALSYSLHGTFLDPIAPDREAPPAEHAAGAYLEWASLAGWSVGASTVVSERGGGEWNSLGGLDFLWLLGERVELSGEILFGEGPREDGALWGLYAQIVVETLPTLHAIARYERFEPPGSSRGLDLVDLGLAWIPVSFLRVKADYRIADRFDDLAEDLGGPGLRASVAWLF